MKSIYSREYEAVIFALIEARKAAEVTQVQLAEKLGKPQPYVSKIENRERRLDIVKFFQIGRGCRSGWD
jgi:transcriptional regulator with XRE-family HTH domain